MDPYFRSPITCREFRDQILGTTSQCFTERGSILSSCRSGYRGRISQEVVLRSCRNMLERCRKSSRPILLELLSSSCAVTHRVTLDKREESLRSKKPVFLQARKVNTKSLVTTPPSYLRMAFDMLICLTVLYQLTSLCCVELNVDCER